MTLIKLFPWLLAVCVTLVSTKLLGRFGWTDFSAISFGIILGGASFALYVFGGRRLLVWCEQKKAQKEQQKVKARKYETLSSETDFPVGKKLFYECVRCGDIIPSLPLNDAKCRCQNISVLRSESRVVIRELSQAKLFSK